MPRDVAAPLLAGALLATAEWRDRIAAQHPRDRRSADAARLCRQIAAELLSGRFNPDTLETLEQLLAGNHAEDQAPMIRPADCANRNVGFKFAPESAEQYLQALCWIVRGGLETASWRGIPGGFGFKTATPFGFL